MTLQTNNTIPAPAFRSKSETKVNRRQQQRRSYSCETMTATFLNPRRATGRRQEDRRYPVLDTPDSSAVALAVLLVVLSCMDAMFTLTLIKAGGSELNPVMDFFLQKSVTLFLLAKLVLTAIPALVLVAAGNVVLFKKFRARTALAALVGIYCGVIVYELGLLTLL